MLVPEDTGMSLRSVAMHEVTKKIYVLGPESEKLVVC